MLKKTITYDDLDGNPVTEDFYFHLSDAEIAEFELEHEGGFKNQLNKVSSTSDVQKIMPIFKDMIGRTVGVRSEDGKRFIKNDEVRDNFMQSDAYSVLFIEMLTNPQVAVEFMSGVVSAKHKATVSTKMTEEFKARQIEKPVRVIDKLELQEVSLDAFGAPHATVTVVSSSMDEAKDATTDEINIPQDEVPAKSVNDFTRNQLIAMDDDTFYGLVGESPRKWSKNVTAIAMARKAGKTE